MHQKSFRLFVLLVVVSAALMSYQSHSGVVLKPFEFLLRPIASIGGAVRSACGSLSDKFEAITARQEEFDTLRVEIARLRAKERAFDELALENMRLSDLLAMKAALPGYVASARVMARTGDIWSGSFVLDKGKADSVAKGMAAVTVDGLAGKIQEAMEDRSVMLSVNDARFSVSVRLQSSRKEAVLSGTGSRNCTLKYVTNDVDVLPGEVVVTSGLDGLFPKGIDVGVVTLVEGNGSLFQYVEVAPFVDPARVEEVAILRN